MPYTPEGTDMTISTAPRRILGTLVLGGTLILAGCDSMLRASDPDIIVTASTASGAIALKNGVVSRFNGATAGIQGPDGIFLFGGLLADEWRSGDTFEQRNTTDARTTLVTNSFLSGPFRDLNRTRVQGRQAIDALRSFSPSPLSNIALMFALTAFSEVQIGETYCNGIPFSDVKGADIVYGNPVTTDSAFKRAINSADSALLNNGGTDAARMTSLAAVVKARALLDRGQYAAAATAVAAVPTTFTYTLTFSLGTRDNQNWGLGNNAGRYVVPDREGTNGMPWISANDPRIPVINKNRNAFDSQTPWFATTIWARSDSIIIASGTEARLIEAEAALQVPNVTTFLSKLNSLRTGVAGLAPLTDPGTQAGQVDLLFQERAFWMFGTGHRLGDLRRLIRQYGRGAETVFPTGTFLKGGNYGPDLNLPISFDELNNPSIPQTPQSQTQSTCIDRKA